MKDEKYYVFPLYCMSYLLKSSMTVQFFAFLKTINCFHLLKFQPISICFVLLYYQSVTQHNGYFKMKKRIKYFFSLYLFFKYF